jgi:hypothetical protein
LGPPLRGDGCTLTSRSEQENAVARKRHRGTINEAHRAISPSPRRSRVGTHSGTNKQRCR